MEHYSVCQFFEDESYEYTRRGVNAEEAVKAFKHYTTNVTARIGLTKRVILVDGSDCIAMEWIFGQGIVFPTPEDFKDIN